MERNEKQGESMSRSVRYRCDNCNQEGPESDFIPAKNMADRIRLMSPGDVYSDIECPGCGSLAFPWEPTLPVREYTVFSDYDGNDTFTVEARNTESAALEALGALGWNLGMPEVGDGETETE